MKIINAIKREINDFSIRERIFFPLTLCVIFAISVLKGDCIPSMISAICGMSYTILAGKGKYYCYYIGMAGTLCYSYLAFTNSFYGNFMLYFCYYFPMEIVGIIKWKKHLKKDSLQIEKTRLSKNERIFYGIISVLACVFTVNVLLMMNDKTPYMDGIVTGLSVIGLILTVKRCIEQWYIWIIVNALSVIMWIEAYISGSDTFALIIMWGIYLYLGFYFLALWKKEMSENEKM